MNHTDKIKFRLASAQKLAKAVQSKQVKIIDVARATRLSRHTILFARHGKCLPTFETCLKINKFLEENEEEKTANN